MYFRILQRLYDDFARGDGRSSYERSRREQEVVERRERVVARQQKKLDPSAYETTDGRHAARVIKLDRRNRPFNESRPWVEIRPDDAHRTAQKAAEEAQRQEWREAFSAFDREMDFDRRLRQDEALKVPFQEMSESFARFREEWLAKTETQLKTEDRPVKERSPESLKGEDLDIHEHERNGNGNGITKPSNGRAPYRQMVLLRDVELPATSTENADQETTEHKDIPSGKSIEFPVETVEPVEDKPVELKPPKEDQGTDWDRVNEISKHVEDADTARRFAQNTEQLGRQEESDFWLSLANEYEIQAEGEDLDPQDEENPEDQD